MAATIKICYTDVFPATPWYVWEQYGHTCHPAGGMMQSGHCHGRFYSLAEAREAFPGAGIAKTADTQMGKIKMFEWALSQFQ